MYVDIGLGATWYRINQRVEYAGSSYIRPEIGCSSV